MNRSNEAAPFGVTAPADAMRNAVTDEAGGARYRHKKTGGEYTVVGTAFLQVATAPVAEGHELVIYQGAAGPLWARGHQEFHDGRFEPIPALAPEPDNLSSVQAEREAHYAARVAQFKAEAGDDTDPASVLAFIERWTAETFPIDQNGQAHFGRAMLEMAADGLRAALAITPTTVNPSALPVDGAPRGSELVWLLIEWDSEAWQPLEDETTGWTVGHRVDGEDEWQFVGWSWAHDHFTDCRSPEHGKVIGWAPIVRPTVAPSYQARVKPWLDACFGPQIAVDKVERNHRFIEEALELVQSTGCTKSEAHQLVDYVYGRPAGDPDQEVGGVMNTLAALCLAHGLDMHEAGERELTRVNKPHILEKIRAKQKAKPKHSPLPEPEEAREMIARRAARAGEANA